MQSRNEASIHPEGTLATEFEPAFHEELETLSEALDDALKAEDLGRFYKVFRGTSLPFLPVDLRKRPYELFRRVSKVVERLGGRSPAVALAVETHYYVLSAIATLPTELDGKLHSRRLELLEQVQAGRWLVANTNSRIHGGQIAKTGTVAKPRGTHFEISGRAVYMSLASEGDLIVFVTFFETGEPAIFACPLTGNPAIEVGPLLFPDAMQDSDTRRVTFHDLEIDESHLLVSGKEHPDILSITTFQLIWHQALLAALSLGTIGRALEEARGFLRSTRRPDGLLLAELDGMVVDMGRQALSQHVARGAVEQAGRALERVASQPLARPALEEALELACAAKYYCTGRAEDIVSVARRIVGARSFTGGHGLERLSREVPFAQLGGEVNAFIERTAGERILNEPSPPRSESRSPRSKSLASIRDRAQARKAEIRGKTSRDGGGGA